MINVTYNNTDWDWGGMVEPGFCAAPDVWQAPAERVSQLLGPDGEPLRVGYERPRMGFDLTPRGAK